MRGSYFATRECTCRQKVELVGDGGEAGVPQPGHVMLQSRTSIIATSSLEQHLLINNGSHPRDMAARHRHCDSHLVRCQQQAAQMLQRRLGAGAHRCLDVLQHRVRHRPLLKRNIQRMEHKKQEGNKFFRWPSSCLKTIAMFPSSILVQLASIDLPGVYTEHLTMKGVEGSVLPLKCTQMCHHMHAPSCQAAGAGQPHQAAAPRRPS